MKQHIDTCSIVVSPFPEGVTLEDLNEFFETKTPDGFKCLRMQRHMVSKAFTGSVFVEFESEKQARWVRNNFKSAVVQFNGQPSPAHFSIQIPVSDLANLAVQHLV